jgi:cytochrome c oxidase subunit 4
MAHIVPAKTNLITLATLLVLTVITVYTAKYVDLGNLNLALAMLIASAKALVVLLWFMHLKYDGNMNRAIIFSTFAFLGLMYGLSATDLFTR